MVVQYDILSTKYVNLNIYWKKYFINKFRMQNIIEKNLMSQKYDKLNKNNWEKLTLRCFSFFIIYNQFISKNIGK